MSGYFVEQTRRKLGIRHLKITEEAIAHLAQYNWPGNVRELEHVISRAALKARARKAEDAMVSIDKTDCGSLKNLGGESINNMVGALSAPIKMGADISLNLKTETEKFQRHLIAQILKEENSNWAAAARRLSTDRANLNRIAKRLNIKVVKSVT